MVEEGIEAFLVVAERSRTLAFQLYCLDRLFGLDLQASLDCITDSGDDRGADAVFIDRDNLSVHILNTKTKSEFSGALKNFPASEIDAVVDLVRRMLRMDSEFIEHCNPALRRKVAEFWDLVEQPGVTLHVHFCSNQSPLTDGETTRAERAFKEDNTVFHQHHLYDFATSRRRLRLAPTNKRFSFAADRHYRSTDGGITTYSGEASAAEIVKLIRAEDGSLDLSIFESNFRGPLGLQEEIQKGMLAGLERSQHELFRVLNNGIKIVCDTISRSGGNCPIFLANPQIVNGCQTASVLFEFSKRWPGRTLETFVRVDIVETDDVEMARQIAIAANSQNRIGTRDLRSNDPVQLLIQEALANAGYLYRRKRGDERVGDPDRTIDNLLCGQLLLAVALGEPEKPKTATEKIFSSLYNQVFAPKVATARRIIALHKLMEAIEKLRERAKQAAKLNTPSAYSEDFVHEGRFHILFVLRLICDLRGVDVYDVEKALLHFDEALAIVAEYFEKAASAAYRVFRAVRAKADLVELVANTVPASSRSIAPTLFDWANSSEAL